MPKKQILEGIIIIIILGFVCKYIYDNYKVEPTTSLVVKESIDCKDSIEEYYTKDDITFYLDCIDDVVVDFTDRTLELNKAYEARQIDINDIKKLLRKKHLVKDKVNYYQGENISMIECIFDDKTNYIIGKDLEYSEGVCSSRPYLTTFTKEYLVIDVSKSKTKDITYITLKDEALDEVTTVSVSGEYELKEASYYSFTFGKYHENKLDDIKTTFTDNVLLGAEEINPVVISNEPVETNVNE